MVVSALFRRSEPRGKQRVVSSYGARLDPRDAGAYLYELLLGAGFQIAEVA